MVTSLGKALTPSFACSLVYRPQIYPQMPSIAPNCHRFDKRVTRDRSNQRKIYYFTAALSNSLLLVQVILGATLTALGASESSHVLITIFGAMNTVIAGLVAYLK